ncbi:hypothetical protein [Paraclostridium sordellii]|uniref:hypothetical protein n=1 Tax=Paraclostridium sordellii TaxID=1505 RepID=UPI0005DE6F97|nr:hypothetical protein [Paeniclostridium sordellii]CEP39028.1 virulence factor MviN [[Clostridium] sordellii] [Paeniclostridium sordellii]
MNKVAKTTIGLIIATILVKISGFGRKLVLASSYGASMYSDEYLTLMSIPLVIFVIIGPTLSIVLIPMHFEINKNTGEEETLKFINNVLNIVIAICIVLATTGFVLSIK